MAELSDGRLPYELPLPLHPILNNPRRAAAYVTLRNNPRGSMRAWASALGWKVSATHRFITRLRAVGLLDLRLGTGNDGSVLVFKRDESGTRPEQQIGTRSERNRNDHRTTSGRLEEEKRILDSRIGNSNGIQTEIEQVMGTMNAILANRFDQEYKPVMTDQIASNKALRELRETDGIPLEFILQRLRYDATAFNPEKAGNGKLPRSFKFFARRIKKAWGRSHRESMGVVVESLPPNLPAASGAATPATRIASEPAAPARRIQASARPSKIEALIERVVSAAGGTTH